MRERTSGQMNPSKIRERKCSTCKHYQPSPLWRKGWCRNPLLYDRNTNHLVEADSLACNRTFIDYWEPITGPAHTVGTSHSGRGARPRIAPSIPMEMMDARGQRVTHTGITPVAGMAAATDEELERGQARGEAAYVQVGEVARELSDDPHSTLVISQIEGPALNGTGTEPVEGLTKPQERVGARAAARKTKVSRPPQRPIIFGMGRDRLLLIGATALVLVVALVSGLVLLGQTRLGARNVPATATAAPLPTPTGFGDPTATAPPAPTVTPVPPPASDVIGIGGWVEATSNVIIRSDATTSGERLGVLKSGTKAHVTEGPREANGFTWWKVDRYDPNSPEASGWCAGQFLKPIPPP